MADAAGARAAGGPGRDAPGRDPPGRDAPGRDPPGRDPPGRDAPASGAFGASSRGVQGFAGEPEAPAGAGRLPGGGLRGPPSFSAPEPPPLSPQIRCVLQVLRTQC